MERNEFRVTRPELYDSGPGRDDVRPRQGHYFSGSNMTFKGAALSAAEQFPTDSVFDIQHFKGIGPDGSDCDETVVQRWNKYGCFIGCSHFTPYHY